MPEHCETCGRAPHPGMSCFAAEPKYPESFDFPMSNAWRDFYSFRFGDGRQVPCEDRPVLGEAPASQSSRPEAPITLVIQPAVKHAAQMVGIEIEGPKKAWRPTDGLAAREV